MTGRIAEIARRLRAFGQDQTGAIRPEAGFAVATGLAMLAIPVALTVLDGRAGDAALRHSPEEIALAELVEVQIRQFDDGQVRERLSRYLDPSERTDAQLRNAHRIWAERVDDPTYDDPDLASDMFAIIDSAMVLRGVRPHEGF